MRELAAQLLLFACVGGAFNVVYVLLYLLLREGTGAQFANAWALVLSTIAGTWGHRRVTFGVRGPERTLVHQTLGLLLLGFSLLITAGSLWLLASSISNPSRTAEVAALVAANLGAGLVRFLVFRAAMRPRSPAHVP